MQLRRFNAAGVQAFRDGLEQCRENNNAELVSDLLGASEFTEIVKPEINVELQEFKTKRDAANYLQVLLSPLNKQSLLSDVGLWSWLSLFHFDVLCPKNKGQRKIRNDYTYVFEAGSMRHFYRHLLFISWRVLDVAPSHNRLLLDTSISSLDNFTDQVMKRLYLTRIPCFFEVLDRIYWDKDLGKARKGMTDKVKISAGDLAHRLPLRIRQLEKTYDLQSLSADQLLELLGDEFRFSST